jgi:hypothetical protein
MKRLNPDKLHVTYLSGTTQDKLILPRRYTLTRSDMTGELFVSAMLLLAKSPIGMSTEVHARSVQVGYLAYDNFCILPLALDHETFLEPGIFLP